MAAPDATEAGAAAEVDAAALAEPEPVPPALPPPPPVRDEMRVWADIAAAAFAADGDMAGWDSDVEREAKKETQEEKYIRVGGRW